MSLTPAVLDALLQAGATAEMIVAAVKADMAEAQEAAEAKRAADAERQRRHRAKAGHAVSRDVTVTPRDEAETVSPSLSPPDPPNHTPIREEYISTREGPTEQPEKPPPKGVRLSTTWTPTPTDQAFAAREGLTPEETAREADRFRDYWCARSGRDATKRDWPGTWRNWVRTCVDRRRGPSASRQAPGGNRQDARSMAEIIARRRREAADREPLSG